MKHYIIKKGLLLFFIFSFAPTIQAQTIREVFISVLSPEMLLLSSNNRMDLLDLYANDKKAVIQNVLGDEVSLNHLTDDYLRIQSGNLTTELFLLTMINESHLIGLIQTVCAPLCDSRMEFYTVSWKKLNSETFISPVDQSWFICENAAFPLDISFMELHYDSEKQLLSQTYQTPSYLSQEDRQTIEKNIREKVKEYKWNGIRFE
jgi:hypothetical protein